MMIYLIVLLVALSAGLLVGAGTAATSSNAERTVNRQLASIRASSVGSRQLLDQRRRQARRVKLQGLLEALGERMRVEDKRTSRLRQLMQQAGIRHTKAVVYYLASRAVAAASLGTLALFLGSVALLSMAEIFLATVIAILAGWMLPAFFLRMRVRRRQHELLQALPDALDLLVVCVEAGLGLNAALVRVGEEMERISPAISDELMVLNLEIRAGKPRSEALRGLAERTGIADIQSLVGMLILSDRIYVPHSSAGWWPNADSSVTGSPSARNTPRSSSEGQGFCSTA